MLPAGMDADEYTRRLAAIRAAVAVELSRAIASEEEETVLVYGLSEIIFKIVFEYGYSPGNHGSVVGRVGQYWGSGE